MNIKIIEKGVAALVLLLLVMGSCSSEDSSKTTEDAGSDSGADGGDTDTDSDTDELPWLEPSDIAFQEVDDPLTGSFIYFGNWDPSVDSLQMITPDGLEHKTRFQVNRLWSFGIASNGTTVAFSSVDPYQEQHWELTLGDAIQYTWLWQDGEDPFQITSGLVNDECHLFSPDDETLFMCRRANFFQEDQGSGVVFGNDPYRILSLDIGSGVETWLTPLADGTHDIAPTVKADGSLFFYRQVQQGASFPTSMMEMNSDGTGIAQVLADASKPVVSDDGLEMLYRVGGSNLVLADPADPASGTTIMTSSDGNFFDYDFSPDMTQIVFTKGRTDAQCSDIWVADKDGQNPSLLVDCVTEDLFPNGVAWVQTP